MNKKSKRKNDLKSSIILLLLLLLLLISATYAWFTANQTVRIDTINVHIEAQNGLQISTDAANWKSIIDNVDITTNAYTGNKNQLPASMEPVSTIGEVTTDGRMKMFYGTSAPDEADGGKYKLSAVEEEYEGAKDDGQPADTGTRRYVAFDIFLKADAETPLQLGLGSNVMMTPTSVVTGNTDKGIKQASRVAFCVLGNKPSGTAASDIVNIAGGTDSYIWEPNANWHTSAANEHAKSNYGVTTDLKLDGTESPVAYNGIKAPISTPVELDSTDTNYFAGVTPDYITWSNAAADKMTDGDATTELTEDKMVDIFTVQAGVTKVRVYMWIEGQDYDCENTASGTDISYNVQIQAKQTATP